MATRTKLILTATTLTLTAILLWISFNQNFILNASGDITCAGTPIYSDLFKKNISDCQIFWDVTSINYTYYFRNKVGVELSFTPEVKGYDMYVKDGRYKSGWRLLDKSGNFTYRKGIKYQFMAFIFKDIEQTIKWRITAADVTTKDPILFGILFTPIKDCITTTEIDIIQIYDTELIFNLNRTICSDFPINQTCHKISLGNSTRQFPIGSYDEFINTTTCENVGFNLSGNRLFYWKKEGWKNCVILNNYIMCEAQHQSNGDGTCQSGEGCSYINFGGQQVKETISKSGSIKEFDEGMIEIEAS